MIIQNINRVDKLNVAEVTDRLTPVTIHLEDFGVYQITIFPIRRDEGIIDSDIGYMQKVILDGMLIGKCTSYTILSSSYIFFVEFNIYTSEKQGTTTSTITIFVVGKQLNVHLCLITVVIIVLM